MQIVAIYFHIICLLKELVSGNKKNSKSITRQIINFKNWRLEFHQRKYTIDEKAYKRAFYITRKYIQ